MFQLGRLVRRCAMWVKARWVGIVCLVIGGFLLVYTNTFEWVLVLGFLLLLACATVYAIVKAVGILVAILLITLGILVHGLCAITHHIFQWVADRLRWAVSG